MITDALMVNGLAVAGFLLLVALNFILRRERVSCYDVLSTDACDTLLNCFQCDYWAPDKGCSRSTQNKYYSEEAKP